MKKSRPVFTDELKNDAARLVLDQGYTVTEACKAVGVGNTALRRWVKQLDGERGGITPTSKAFTPDQQRIQELEARIKEIEWEKDILKKATALLMQDGMKR